MSIEITFGRCGAKLITTKMLRSAKDIMKKYDSKCPSCGEHLSTTDFEMDIEKR